MRNLLALYLLSFLTLLSPTIGAQNKVLQFDGVNDYLDLGNVAGNNLRTIELWFKPSQNINSSINDFQSLVVRNTGLAGPADQYEFGLLFDYIGINSGKLRFYMNDNTSNQYNIYSDSNQWKANQWYHVAAVIDSVQGMKLFIDGILQLQTNSYTGHTGSSTYITAAGRWGDYNSRYFKGSIDNLKFYSNSIYSNNFNPECPNFPSAFPDRAVWSFNGASFSTAFDGTSNSFFANIYGSTRLLDEVCNAGNVISFDGIDDYLNLGNQSGNNVRTIEMWFKPSVTINSSTSRFHTLIARNTGLLGAGDHFEFGLTFTHLFPNKGKLRFFANDNLSTTYNIYSDNNQWLANKWYHVAAVIDPTSGMKMYIDGVLQNDTDSYSADTDTSRFYTAVGRWGDYTGNRYFNGKIDDLKMHSTAIYSSNFTPPCPDQTSLIADHGNWNFNGKSRTYATDSSANNFLASIFGANRYTDTICNLSVGIVSNSISNNDLLVYPNPSHKWINFNFKNEDQRTYTLELIDTKGQLILSKSIDSSNSTVNIEQLSNGIYFYRLVGIQSSYSGKFIKH